MKGLRQVCYCTVTDNRKWVLVRDLSEFSLDELYRLMGFDMTKVSYRNSNSADAINVAEEARL